MFPKGEVQKVGLPVRIIGDTVRREITSAGQLESTWASC